ncbi:hypothetical protein MAR_002950 [Mya arenaria]|uniref:Uncharacterized protein n=1 Tax=Mya arenaria TaxID=6604 RepID=A0ABY7G7S7_MYAAR|nr:hypothetical protein MAR_002950 [Mya arenaria]
MDMPVLSFFPSEAHLITDSYNFVVDALFGFSFKGVSLRVPRPTPGEQFLTVMWNVCNTLSTGHTSAKSRAAEQSQRSGSIIEMPLKVSINTNRLTNPCERPTCGVSCNLSSCVSCGRDNHDFFQKAVFNHGNRVEHDPTNVLVVTDTPADVRNGCRVSGSVGNGTGGVVNAGGLMTPISRSDLITDSVTTGAT